MFTLFAVILAALVAPVVSRVAVRFIDDVMTWADAILYPEEQSTDGKTPRQVKADKTFLNGITLVGILAAMLASFAAGTAGYHSLAILCGILVGTLPALGLALLTTVVYAWDYGQKLYRGQIKLKGFKFSIGFSFSLSPLQWCSSLIRVIDDSYAGVKQVVLKAAKETVDETAAPAAPLDPAKAPAADDTTPPAAPLDASV